MPRIVRRGSSPVRAEPEAKGERRRRRKGRRIEPAVAVRVGDVVIADPVRLLPEVRVEIRPANGGRDRKAGLRDGDVVGSVAFY